MACLLLRSACLFTQTQSVRVEHKSFFKNVTIELHRLQKCNKLCLSFFAACFYSIDIILYLFNLSRFPKTGMLGAYLKTKQ